jgi:hypothetical protein
MFELSSSLRIRYGNAHRGILTFQLSLGMSRLPGEAVGANTGASVADTRIGEGLPLYSIAKQTHFVLVIA